MITYSIDNMRVVKPSVKVKADNPDRIFTVKGTFWATEPVLDPKTNQPTGTVCRTEKLTIAQKEVTFEIATGGEFAYDLAAGLLTLPSGERGRKASVGLTADEIAAELESLRNPETEPETKTETATETATN